MNDRVLITIVGPTASGKTDLAAAIARYYQTEIISADSRQVYKELNIGVARPDPQLLAEIKHHFIASHSVLDDFNAGKFEIAAIAVLEQVFRNHPVAVMVGGSGLYIKAVCEGLDEIPADSRVRKILQQELKSRGLPALVDKLRSVDPAYCSVADLANPRRVLRALEVALSTGRPYSSFRQGHRKSRNFRIIKIGLALPRNELYTRIQQRVDEMMKKGLLEECRKLLHYKEIPALQTVGYKELFDYLEGKTSLPDAVENIKQNTRNFAKRQMTWFRKDAGIRWFNPEQPQVILWYLDNLLGNMRSLAGERT
ncbi:MAG: tRNA dimethylallyltransferase 1 [Chitinophagales bacterium]|nr:MAG: tRNA dimethylallyltransferase 1 [Chitinophagales bacterium]